MRRKLAAAGLGIGLAFAGTACNAHETASARPTFVMPKHPYDIAASDKTYIEGRFTAYAGHLKRIGAIAADTKLILLNGGDTLTCKEPGDLPPQHMSAQSISEYCPSEHAVVLTAGDMNAARYVGKYHAQISFIIAHELGHAEQERQGELTASSLSMPEHPYIEEQATCYGGETMKLFDPSYATTVNELLLDTPTDPAHGTSRAQAGAFMAGATTGHCPLGYTPAS
ncbi:MAG TPA: hypothetical protein VIM53_00845 [Candidatus Saccharimonadales bacterium]